MLENSTSITKSQEILKLLATWLGEQGNEQEYYVPEIFPCILMCADSVLLHK